MLYYNNYKFREECSALPSEVKRAAVEQMGCQGNPETAEQQNGELWLGREEHVTARKVAGS